MSKKDSGADLSSYIYVDARHGNSKWDRITIDNLPAYIEKHKHHDVYCTIQRYSLKKRSDNDEPMHAPLFFDIDSSRNILQLLDQGWVFLEELAPYLLPEVYLELERREMGQPIKDEYLIDLAVKPYKVDNPEDKEKRVEHFRPLSEDLKMFVWKKNIDVARRDAQKIAEFFTAFGLTEDEVRVWFSGNKGFHILVHEGVVGIEPHIHLHRAIKHIAVFLESLLDLRSLDKASIYGKGRQWRIADTINPKSGRYKTEITYAELTGEIAHILEISKTPHGPLYNPEEQEFTLNDKLNVWYRGHYTDWEASEKAAASRVSDSHIEALKSMEGYPTCVRWIFDHGGELIRQAGHNRNAITIRLGTYFKDAGFSFQEAYDRIIEWAMALPADASSSTASEKRANTTSTLRAVYDGANYRFSCGAIRSVGKKDKMSKTIVPCSGRACAVHEDHGLDLVEATHLHLAETAKAEYVSTPAHQEKLEFDALVAGKLDTPYQVPKKVEFYCKAMDLEKPICQTCVMAEHDGAYEKEFHENDRFLIEAANQPDNNLTGILRKKYSNASCDKVKFNILSYTNVTEILVVPMADRVTSIRVGDDDKAQPLASPVDETGHDYVQRKIYVVGSKEVKSNEYYKFTGYAYPHPKTQLATVLSQDQEPKQDSIGSFQLTPELIEAFKVFQVQPGETLSDRLDLIIGDLSANVTKVRERDPIHLAVLLSYHSVLRYYFRPDELEARGWIEVCLVGDTGQAKTQLVDRLQQFAGLGEIVGGELASRTGLLYALEKMGDRWFITFGKYPLNDRKLLAIDEFSGLPDGDFEQMTESRETGVLRVSRIVKTETNARTRLIFMSNPRFGKQLAEFSYAVESLKYLFREAADIRRLDLAVFLKSGDVPKSVLNAEYPVPEHQMIKSEVLKASILWAWSRTEHQVTITKEAMKIILASATRLGDKYGAAIDIPLLEPATLRKKMARMSIALAGLLHSTDETHESIVVLPEHVDYIETYIDTMYSFKNCRLDIYAARMKNEGILDKDEAEKLMGELAEGDFASNTHATREVFDIFRKNDTLKAQDVIDMTGLERGTVNSRLALLQRYSMIKRGREGIKKLPKFIEFLELYFGEE